MGSYCEHPLSERVTGSTNSMSGSTDNNMEDNSKFPYLNTLNQSCDNSWRMTRYMSGMSVARLASFLAWTGMVCSFIFIIGAIGVIFLPLSFGVAHMCHNSNSFNNRGYTDNVGGQRVPYLQLFLLLL